MDKDGKKYAAPSGAAVVMDPQTGRVIALATTPTYDPTVFVGGISRTELSRLTDEDAGVPLISRAVAGQFAPGSTFKLSSTSAEVMSGRAPLSGRYSCPGSLQVGNREKRNFEGRGIAGSIDLRIALAKSCDTIYYGFAQTDWYADEARVDDGQKPAEVLQRMARAYGFGQEPGIDLPAGEQTSGPDRGPGVQEGALGRREGAVLRGRQARLPGRHRRGPAQLPDPAGPGKLLGRLAVPGR